MTDNASLVIPKQDEESDMAKDLRRHRFEYDRMTADEVNEAFDQLGITDGTFARLWGVQKRIVKEWLNGKMMPPVWACIAIRMMQDNPSCVVAVRDAAAAIIRKDNIRPEAGLYPYMNTGGQNDEDN